MWDKSHRTKRSNQICYYRWSIQHSLSVIKVRKKNSKNIVTLTSTIQELDLLKIYTSFVNINKPTGKFIWKGKRPRIANTALKKNNKIEELTPSNFMTIQGYCNEESMTLVKNKHMNQWKSRNRPETDLYKYSQLIIGQRAKASQWREDFFFFFPKK